MILGYWQSFTWFLNITHVIVIENYNWKNCLTHWATDRISSTTSLLCILFTFEIMYKKFSVEQIYQTSRQIWIESLDRPNHCITSLGSGAAICHLEHNTRFCRNYFKRSHFQTQLEANFHQITVKSIHILGRMSPKPNTQLKLSRLPPYP